MPGATVNVATVCVESIVTLPVGSTHGAIQVTVNEPMTPTGAIFSLKIALTVSLIATPVAFFVGSTAVTVGGGGAVPVVNFHE